jgi:hypothetical protein
MDDESDEEPAADQDAEHESFRVAMHAASAPRDAVPPATEAARSRHPAPKRDEPGTALARTVVQGEIVPADYERQLDPRSMKDARVLAEDMYARRCSRAYGSPQAVLSTVMVGRELGLPAMASLRAIHNIEGRHALSASLMVALVLKSGMAEYFEPVSFTDTEATYETKRKGARNPVRLTHTIEMARQAWPKARRPTRRSWTKRSCVRGERMGEVPDRHARRPRDVAAGPHGLPGPARGTLHA